MKVDLNSDLGEGAGHDDEILSLVSSANIACGFHAGNPASIFNSISAAKKKGVAVGAHPSLDDRTNFGRTEMQLSAAEAYALVAYQVGAFHALCAAAGVEMNHVKPHGALYNMAVRNRELSDAIAHGVLAIDTRAILFAPARTELFRAAQELGLQTAAEVFADRNYNSDGTLVSRIKPDALLHDPAAAAERVVRMLTEGKIRAVDGSEVSVKAETICLHGDKPDAVEFARTLRARLEREGIIIAPPEKS
jgi:5-oxoprolinase (ATP-hydrolysing) subunit A